MGVFELRGWRSVRSLAAVVASSVACSTVFAASADQGAAAASTAAASDAIEEIVVTAERREETVQKSSVPIQVVTGEGLERSDVTQSTDLNRIVPGLQIGTGGDAPQIYIRGIGDFAVSALSNPAVAFNVDGVYVARPQGTNSEFYDLE